MLYGCLRIVLNEHDALHNPNHVVSEFLEKFQKPLSGFECVTG